MWENQTFPTLSVSKVHDCTFSVVVRHRIDNALRNSSNVDKSRLPD